MCLQISTSFSLGTLHAHVGAKARQETQAFAYVVAPCNPDHLSGPVTVPPVVSAGQLVLQLLPIQRLLPESVVPLGFTTESRVLRSLRLLIIFCTSVCVTGCPAAHSLELIVCHAA